MISVEQHKESLRMAWSAVQANKTRGILTTLGIIIGIVAVSTTMTVSNGLGNSFKQSFSSLGTDVLYVSRMPWIIMDDFFQYRNRPTITFKESEKLQQRLRTALAVNPTTGTNRNVKYRSQVLENVAVVGTTDKQTLMNAAVPEFGHFITPVDVQYKKQVCVIGAEIHDHLFKNSGGLQKTIQIGRYPFRVIGIMEKQGSAGFFGGPNLDRQILIPITTLVQVFGGSQRDFNIAVKAPSQESLDDFRCELMSEMRKLRKLSPTEPDNFSINTMDTLMNAYNRVMGVVVLIGMVITGLSLFVGGIGVMNIMFVSVTERTREIGIRKAIGAPRRTILMQFLFESSSICILGGMIGVLLSFGVAALINRLLLPASVSPGVVLIALLVSMATGILSGILPAYQASRLNPIDALRYE